jgi:light-harvesting complex I chlorophyll a/b binding protein 4
MFSSLYLLFVMTCNVLFRVRGINAFAYNFFRQLIPNMSRLAATITLLLASVAAFTPATGKIATRSALKMADTSAKFDPLTEAGISGPFGLFDPIGLCPDNKFDFMRYRESELKHGRVAMLAVVGFLVGETDLTFLDTNAGSNSVFEMAINQYQFADGLIPALTANVIGFTAAVEGYNIVNGWETLGEYSGMAGVKESYTNGDLKFDPLGLKPKNAKDLKTMQTKEINNGRLAMLAIAGMVAQELVSQTPIL